MRLSKNKMSNQKPFSIFAPSAFWRIVILVAVLAIGFGTRLYDLKDPPLDYAGARQLRSMMITRGKYYAMLDDAPEWKKDIARKQANIHGMIEPEIIESITAASYLIVGRELPWIARIYSSLSWVLGGLALYILTRKMVSDDGAMIALIYYLFVPFGLVASRTFQPDPLMTAMIITAWLAFYFWYQTSSWKWAIASGLTAGAAMFIKSTAVFFLLFGMAAVVLSRERISRILRDAQVWVIALLSGIPVLSYHIYGIFILGELESQLKGRFFPQIWDDPGFYRQWKNALTSVTGHTAILLLGLAGLVLIKKRLDRRLLLGVWLGYLLYGFGFSYHISTHYYYTLPVIPLLAVTIGSLAEGVFGWLRKPWLIPLIRLGTAAVILVGVGGGYYSLHEEDYGHEPGYYEKVAGFVNPESDIVALSQDYGYRLSYYGWLAVQPWKGTEDLRYIELRDSEVDPFSKRFAQFSSEYDYFVITRMKELRRQEKLHDELYDNYPIVREGSGYVIFDLQNPVE